MSEKHDSPYARFTEDELILRDVLAVDRTILANERTLLGFFRTALALLITGLYLLKFFTGPWMHALGIVIAVLAVPTFVVGAWRYEKTRRSLQPLRRKAS